MDETEKKKGAEEEVETVRIELGRGAKGFAFVTMVLLAGIMALLAAPLLHGCLPEAPTRQDRARQAHDEARRDSDAGRNPSDASTATATPTPATADASTATATAVASARAAAEAACAATCQGGPSSAECVACTHLLWGF